MMQPAIILIGGYNSVWPAYLGAARRLEDVSGFRAIGVPLTPWDWWRADRQQDASAILTRLADTVQWARRKWNAGECILVGHSAGGLIARLYLSDQPVWGQTYAGARHVSALITLGSPHCPETSPNWYLIREANRLAPETPHADSLYYLSIAGQSVRGDAQGRFAERRAFRSYQYFAQNGAQIGDAVIPVDAAHLPGAKNIAVEGIVHSRKYGAHWYLGSQALVRRWWPQDLGHE